MAGRVFGPPDFESALSRADDQPAGAGPRGAYALESDLRGFFRREAL